jgi:hypothetical protein
MDEMLARLRECGARHSVETAELLCRMSAATTVGLRCAAEVAG